MEYFLDFQKLSCPLEFLHLLPSTNIFPLMRLASYAISITTRKEIVETKEVANERGGPETTKQVKLRLTKTSRGKKAPSKIGFELVLNLF